MAAAQNRLAGACRGSCFPARPRPGGRGPWEDLVQSSSGAAAAQAGGGARPKGNGSLAAPCRPSRPRGMRVTRLKPLTIATHREATKMSLTGRAWKAQMRPSRPYGRPYTGSLQDCANVAADTTPGRAQPRCERHDTALGRLATSLAVIRPPKPPLRPERSFGVPDASDLTTPSRDRTRCGPADTAVGRTCSSSLAALSRPKAADATLGRIPLLGRSAAHAGRRHGPRRDRPPIACCGHGPWPRTACAHGPWPRTATRCGRSPHGTPLRGLPCCAPPADTAHRRALPSFS